MIKICKYCGKEFEGTGTASYCAGPHFAICEVCGKEFEHDVRNPKRCCSKKCSATLRKQSISKITKICELCGKEFTSDSNTAKYCNDVHYRPCPICGKPVEIDVSNVSAIHGCSPECSNKLREQNCLDKYGVASPSQSDEVRDKLRKASIRSESKRRATSLKRYGVPNPAMSPEVAYKIKATVLGNDCQDRTRKTMLSRYGVAYSMQSKELSRRQSCNLKRVSSLEIRLRNFLCEYGIEYVTNYALTSEEHNFTHRFDVYLPKYKLLIDCDGIFYHGYLDDADGKFIHQDYDELRLTTIPSDYMFVVIVESQFEQGLRNLQKILHQLDEGIFDYDTQLFNWCRSQSFPYPEYTESRMLKEYNKLCRLEIPKYNSHCKTGSSIISNFHKSIYFCNVNKLPSPIEAWNDNHLLKKCIENRLIYQNDVDPSKVLYGFNVSKIAPKVSVFNPVLARYLTLKYLSIYDNVVDPFSGFSGRLLGVTSTGKKYVGFDLNQLAVDESNNIINFLRLSAEISTKDLLNTQPTDGFDCMLTCPPYSAKEHYSTETVFHSCDEWIEICMNTYKCKRYVFVVDDTTRYEQYVVETLPVRSHFRNNAEKIIVIDRT